MQATLNIRIDETLKERGDRVLRDNGVSTSTAVRSLWAHMASTRAVSYTHLFRCSRSWRRTPAA